MYLWSSYLPVSYSSQLIFGNSSLHYYSDKRLSVKTNCNTLKSVLIFCRHNDPKKSSPPSNNGTFRAPSVSGMSTYHGSHAQSHSRASSRRGSVSSEPAEVAPSHVQLVKDHYKFWYKPTISREEAISMLRPRPPGTFVVRDSNR